MQELSFELSIGDTVQIGELQLTLIEIEGDELHFDLEGDSEEFGKPQTGDQKLDFLPPR